MPDDHDDLDDHDRDDLDALDEWVGDRVTLRRRGDRPKA